MTFDNLYPLYCEGGAILPNETRARGGAERSFSCKTHMSLSKDPAVNPSSKHDGDTDVGSDM